MKRRILFATMAFGLLLAACQAIVVPEPTPTPEIFIPLGEAIPDPGITLEGVHLSIIGTTLGATFPSGCSGAAPGCTQAKDGSRILAIALTPRDLPDGNMLAYKQLPPVSVAMEGAAAVPVSLTQYNNASRQLTLGFEVPAGAKVFGLRWADLAEIPLRVDIQE